MRDIGKNIKQLRIQKNMTQDELAEKLFVTRQTVSNYETGRSRPDVEMLAKIAEVLETDANAVLYGPAPAPDKAPVRTLLAGCILLLLLLTVRKLMEPYASVLRANFEIWAEMLVYSLLDPLIWLTAGWTILKALTMALKTRPLKGRWTLPVRRFLCLLLVLWLVILVPYLTAFSLDSHLYSAQIRGEWVEEPYEANGLTVIGKAWKRIPLPCLRYLEPLGEPVMQQTFLHRQYFILPGALLCLLGFPSKTEDLKNREDP